jgi:hypothetical protein
LVVLLVQLRDRMKDPTTRGDKLGQADELIHESIRQEAEAENPGEDTVRRVAAELGPASGEVDRVVDSRVLEISP